MCCHPAISICLLCNAFGECLSGSLVQVRAAFGSRLDIWTLGLDYVEVLWMPFLFPPPRLGR